MIIDKVRQKIDEFQKIVKDKYYFPIVEIIVRRIIEDANCPMSLGTEDGRSGHEWNEVANTFKIRINDKPENPKDIIWDMLHEFGHFLDPVRITKIEENDIVKVRIRELKAWELAEVELRKIDGLVKDFKEFEDYKWAKLKTYGVKRN